MRVAIFDFDGTLYPGETFPILMKHLKTHKQYKSKYIHFIRKVLPIYIAYKCKLYQEKKMKEQSMQFYLSVFHKFTTEELNLYFSDIANRMKGKYNEKVIEALKKHRNDGYHVMLVSGAYLPLLEAIGKEFRFDSIIGTDVPYDNNLVAGKKGIFHVQGERKRQKVYEQFANIEVDWENSIAYGDSFSDLPILEMVGSAVAVNPEPRLKEIAQKRKWKIIE